MSGLITLELWTYTSDDQKSAKVTYPEQHYSHAGHDDGLRFDVLPSRLAQGGCVGVISQLQCDSDSVTVTV